MPWYVVRMEGEIDPQLGVLHDKLEISLQSFSLTMNGNNVSVVPNAGVQLERDQAELVLQREMNPLLAMLSFENRRILKFRIRNVISNNPEQERVTSLHVTADIYTSAAISLKATSDKSQDVQRQVELATVDQTYRELLNLTAEAMEAPNPRPAGYKIVERLEERYGGRDKFCAQLGLKKADLKPLVADQSKYAGDRHAEYPLGAEPDQLSESAKSEALAVIYRIIEEYKKRELATT